MVDTIRVIGAPVDLGASRRGTDMGPSAMRAAGLHDRLKSLGYRVQDAGNVYAPEMEQNADACEVDLRYANEILAACDQLADCVEGAVRDGAMPLVLGGDHSVAIGTQAGLARHSKDRGLIWFDAHADFNTHETSPSGNIHGMPVACLCGQGPQELTGIGGHTPALNPKDIRQIGIRSVDAGEKRLVHDMGIEVFDMRYIDEMGMRHTMELALALVDANTHLHVSLDVDFLDPDIAPGVGTTVRGGPTYREAQLCMEMVADTGRLASLDIVELNPALDVRNQTAELAVDLVESLFGKSTLMRA